MAKAPPEMIILISPLPIPSDYPMCSWSVSSTHLFPPSRRPVFLVLLAVFLTVLLLMMGGSLVSLLWRGCLTAMPLVVLLAFLQLKDTMMRCVYYGIV